MKRSEAVGQMAGYLSGYPEFHKRHPQDLVELARHVIEGAEKIGMLPPEAPFYPIKREVTGFDPGPTPVYATKWESEVSIQSGNEK